MCLEDLMKVIDNRRNNGRFIFEVVIEGSRSDTRRIGNIQNCDALNTTVVNEISRCRH